jgi:hypothetical protein
MANVNAPFGLRPVRYASGQPYTGACNKYFATGATGAIRIGDPVIMAGSANTAVVQGHAPGTLPTVTVALDGSGDPITGVCVGVLPVTADSLPYRVTSTDRIILVADNPDIIFQVQSDAGGTALAAADIGQFAVLKAGTTALLISDWTIDTSVSPATTAGFQLQLIRFSALPNNEIGTYAVMDVTINNHQFANIADGGRFTAV